ncbi:MAG: hypothetical protein ABSG22_09580 [Sedimentisphaerales bacterium]
MNVNLMSRIGVCGFICLAITLGLADISYADLPLVIGNWEGSDDGWKVDPEALDGTTAKAVRENATLGNYSYKVFARPEWQKAVSLDFSGDTNLLTDLGKAAQLKVDVTLKAKEWSIGSGFVKAIECIIIRDDKSDWQQIEPTTDQREISWDGKADKTVTVTFDIPPQTPPKLTKGIIILITNYQDVNTAGNFYFDNVRLLGAAEPNQPKEVVKPVEPKKASEPIKQSEPNKPAKAK